MSSFVFVDTTRSCDVWCLRCLLLMMYTHPFAKKALTLHLASSEGHERYFGCNLMHRNVLASFHQHLMAEAPKHDVVFRGEEIEQAGERTHQIRKRAPSVAERQVDEEDCGGDARLALDWCLRRLLLVMCRHPFAKRRLRSI